MLIRAVTATLLAAAMLCVPAAAAQAQSTQAIEFTVSDGEAPEVFIFQDPNCAPDIICKPRRVQAFITFKVSTNTLLSGNTLKVTLETVNGSAVAPGDYCPTIQTVSFSDTFDQYVSVCVKFNTAIEPTETFTVRLLNPSVPAGVSDTGTGTIFDGPEFVY
jgi:hypothetical protein